MFTYAELLLLSSKDVPNLKITREKETLENAALALEEIFNDNSLKNGRNIENWEKWNLWLLEKKPYSLENKSCSIIFRSIIFSESISKI